MTQMQSNGPMKNSIFFLALSLCLVAACDGGGSTEKGSSSGGSAGTGAGGAGAGGTGAAGAGGSTTSAPAGPFDLHLDVGITDASGAAYQTTLIAAVRDAETQELIAYANSGYDYVDSVKLDAPAKLIAGRSYSVGIRDVAGMECHRRELKAISASVMDSIRIAKGTELDPTGCDLTVSPVALPSGTYATTAPPLGVAGNDVTLLVSASGRLYYDNVRVFCSNAQCDPTVFSSGPTCENEIVLPPGVLDFDLGAAGSYTQVSGTATIDPATKTIHYVGKTLTFTANTNCCEESFDVTLERVGAPSEICP